MGKRIDWTAIFGAVIVASFVFIALAAFVLSYAALYTVAVDSGVGRWLAWLWPLTLDTVMIAAGAVILWNGVRRERAILAWLMSIGFAAASVFFNMEHAGAALVSKFVFALPPVALFLLIKLVSGQIGGWVRKSNVMQSLAEIERTRKLAIAEVRELEAKADAAEKRLLEMGLQSAQSAQPTEQVQAIPQLQSATGSNQRKVDLQELLALALANPQAQGKWYAEQLGVSPSAITRSLQALEASGQLHRNGHGHAAQAEAEPQAQEAAR